MMNQEFAKVIEGLRPSFEKLLAMEPCSNGFLPRIMPPSGVYLFSEAGKHLYVGRSRNIRRRYGLHTRPSAPHNQASFAFLLAREQLGIVGASYKADQLSRKGLPKDEHFMKQFENSKQRVRKMDFRFVEELDATCQALLEIYCSVSLSTPYNDFQTH